MEMNSKVPEDILKDINYYSYMVQYQGDIKKEVEQYPGYYVTIINDNYAIVTVKREFILQGKDINLAGPHFSTIVYVKPAEMFTLEQISPLEASNAEFLSLDLPLTLTGNGVNVAIIDSGIDYLNDEFMDSNGQTRIEAIWDQTVTPINKNQDINVPFGTVYTKSQIQDAINAYRQGNSPYDIVPTKDDIGHGTSMTGIIGGSGKNPNLKGVVPECNFVVVKLMVDLPFSTWFNVTVPVFNITSIFAALEFLSRYALLNNKPMIIYLPLGSNLGSHKGNGILEQFIDSICTNSGIAIVTGAGNQAANNEHASGTLSTVGGISILELSVSPEQKDLWVEIWVDSPNIMSLDILSPSGENTSIMTALISSTEIYTFLFEKTMIRVNYYLPEENTGDELIRIRFYDLQPGIWKLRLTGNSILDGKYNAWIPQNGISLGGTKFISPDIYGTVTNPGTSTYIITVAAYNQNNNNVLAYSGMAFIDNYINIINIAAGGENALTVAPGNKTAIVSGTSVAAAIVAGACAMLFEWGIVDGNDPFMYSQTILTYLARGTSTRVGDIYPNPQWGYGILNIFSMFQNMT